MGYETSDLAGVADNVKDAWHRYPLALPSKSGATHDVDSATGHRRTLRACSFAIWPPFVRNASAPVWT